MKLNFSRSFYESFDILPRERQIRVKKALEALRDFYLSGIRAEGLGLKKLRKNYWEIRASLGIRIIFTLEGDEITFVIAGTHEDIKRFLKNI